MDRYRINIGGSIDPGRGPKGAPRRHRKWEGTCVRPLGVRCPQRLWEGTRVRPLGVGCPRNICRPWAPRGATGKRNVFHGTSEEPSWGDGRGASCKATSQNALAIVAAPGGCHAIRLKGPGTAGRTSGQPPSCPGSPGNVNHPQGPEVRSATTASVLLDLYLLGLLGSFHTYLVGETIANFS